MIDRIRDLLPMTENRLYMTCSNLFEKTYKSDIITL